MGTGDRLTLFETADAIGVEPWRLARLGRYLKLDPSERSIPWSEVAPFLTLPEPVDRFAAVRVWLIARIKEADPCAI